jgi:hypothetical protein
MTSVDNVELLVLADGPDEARLAGNPSRPVGIDTRPIAARGR